MQLAGMAYDMAIAAAESIKSPLDGDKRAVSRALREQYEDAILVYMHASQKYLASLLPIELAN